MGIMNEKQALQKPSFVFRTPYGLSGQVWELTWFSSDIQCRGVSMSLSVYQLNAFLYGLVYTLYSEMVHLSCFRKT